MKPVQEQFELAISGIKRGKPEKILCWEYFYWEERVMIVRRGDTGEDVCKNELSEEAVAMEMNDEVVE